MSMVVAAMAAVALLVVSLALGRHYHHGSRLVEWRELLDDAATRSLAMVSVRSDMDRTLVEDAMQGAREARRVAGDDVAELLALASFVIQDATTNRMMRLRGMAQATRMAMAIYPLPAVTPARFQGRRLSLLAAAAAALHVALVAPAERYLVRLRLLMVGFWLTARMVRRGAVAAAAEPSADYLWSRLERALADWQALDEEHVESFRALLLSLTAELRRAVVAQP